MEIDYSWWGWVDVSHDMMPRVCQPDPRQSVYYALGYGGNGVSYSQQAGRLAEQIAGRAHGRRCRSSRRRCLPFAPFRRLGQRMLYLSYFRNDEKP